MSITDELTELFRKLPGVGPRQARRFVYILLKKPREYRERLSELVSRLGESVKTCSFCFRPFETAIETSLCSICSDKSRANLLMVVARDVDLENVEKTGLYRGFYFILGGAVPLLEPKPTSKVRIRELTETIERHSPPFKEIILSMDANPDGQNTLEYVKGILSQITEKRGIKLSSLGRGLSTGTELEYSDIDTIRDALEGRR